MVGFFFSICDIFGVMLSIEYKVDLLGEWVEIVMGVLFLGLVVCFWLNCNWVRSLLFIFF